LLANKIDLLWLETCKLMAMVQQTSNEKEDGKQWVHEGRMKRLRGSAGLHGR
jgi:hypothetical protein